MFVAMNRFRVIAGQEAAFEAVWLGRDSHLEHVPGFLGFNLLRGPTAEDHTLFSSMSRWVSRADFEAWTRSDAFRAAHRGAGDNKPLYLGHPHFEGFESLQEVSPA
jgi:heme-degrading monooxygenase HmoA